MDEAEARKLLIEGILRCFPPKEAPGALMAVDELWRQTYRLAYADGVADQRARDPMTEEELDKEGS